MNQMPGKIKKILQLLLGEKALRGKPVASRVDQPGTWRKLVNLDQRLGGHHR